MNKTNAYILIVCFLQINTALWSADFYWIGGTGNWSDPSHWSNTSGGASAGAVPTAADNAIFDNNSGLTGIASTVTMNTAVTITDFDFSSVTNAFTLAGALPSIEIQGSLSSNGLASITYTGDINMNPSTSGNFVVSNGTIWNNDFHCNGTTSITLNDDFNSLKNFYVNNGGLTLGGSLFECVDFFSNTTNTRTINLNNTALTLNGTNWLINGTSLTLNSTPSVIQLTTGATFTFTGGGQDYDTLRSTAATLEIYDNNSFSLTELSPSSELSLDNGSAQQIDSLITSGNCSSSTIINTLNNTLAFATIEKTGHNQLNANHLEIINVNAVTGGGQTYNIALSDTTNALNWSYEGTKFYWINNGGNWSDSTHWSFTSGGGIAGCMPGPEDSVIFDLNSFAVLNDTVFVDVESYFGYMNWSTATNNPSLKLNAPLHAYGDMLFTPNMNVTSIVTGLMVNRTSNLTSNDLVLDCFISVDMDDETDSLRLVDHYHSVDLNGILIFRGELHAQADSLTLGFLRVFERATVDNKKIQLNNCAVELKVGFSAEGVNGEFTFDAGNSHVTVGDSVYENYIITDMSTMNFWDVTLNYHSATNDQVISGPNFSYNKLNILKGSHVVIDSLSLHTINDSLIMIGNCSDSIYLSSSDLAIPCTFIKTTATDLIAECIAFSGIGAGGVSLSANYSNDVTGNNTNWTINETPPVAASYTADGPFCFGDTTIFTDVSTVQAGLTNDYTIYWNFDDGSSIYHDQTTDTTSHTFLNGGDFDVEMITEYSNFCVDTFISTVHINQPDVYLISDESSQIICEGTPVTFETGSVTSNTEFEFFLNGTSLNTPSPNDTIFVTNNLTNQDSISVNSYENGCVTENPAYLIFTVNDAPVFTWTSTDADTTICASNSVTFTASSSDPTLNYQFLLNNTPVTFYSASGNFQTNGITNNLDMVSLVAQSNIGCTDTLDMEFTVHPLPSTTLDDDIVGNVICANDLITFTANGANTYEFFVDGVSQFGPSNTNTWATSSLSTGQVVTVIGYSIENCQFEAPETFTYTVSPLPVIGQTISDADTSICSGTNVNFTLSGAAQYQLYINGTSQGAPQPVNDFDLATLNHNDTVYFEGTFGACSNYSDTSIWEVFAAPTTSLVSDDADDIICDGTEVIFTASGANNYEFFVNGVSQGTPSPNNQFITSTINNGEVIMVAGESNNCYVNQSITYTVLPIPAVNVFSDNPNNEMCEGASITFTGANADQYELFINGVSTMGPQSSPVFTPVLSPGSNAIYLIGTAPNGCSDTSATTINMTVHPTPTVVLSSSDINDTICSGETVTFTGTGSDMYQFFLNGVPLGSMSATNTYTSNNLLDGQSISVIGSSFGCTNGSNTIITTVNPIPSVNLTSTDPDNVFCADELVEFTATGATNYEFTVNGASQGPASPINSINSTGFATGSYSIQVVGESNNCSNSSSTNITVNGLPTASLTSSDTDNTICSGELVTYTGSGGALFEFFINGNSQGPATTLNTIDLNNLADGDIVSVTIADATGCDDSEALSSITVNPTPNVTLSSTAVNEEICLGENTTFNGAGSDEYEFFINGASQGPASATNSFSTNTLNNGDVVSLTGTSLGCSSSSNNLTFTVHTAPIVTLSNNGDLNLCAGENTDLIATGGTTYQFLINGAPSGPFGASDSFTNPLNNGDVVTVIGDLNGCQETAPSSYTFNVNPYPTINTTINPGTTICTDELVSFSASGANEYTFDLNGATLQSGSTSTFDINTLEDNDVINITGFNGDCPSTIDTYTFTVHSMNLDLSITPSNLVCEGETVTFTATGGDQYEFFVNGISQGAMSNNNSFSSASLNSYDEVTFNAYSNTTSCTQAYNDFVILNILDQPVIAPLSALQFCEGDSVVLVSNASYGNQWYLNGSPIQGATDTSYVVHATGDYGLTVTAGGNGDVWSFGHNSYGNFGNGTATNSPDPTMAITNEKFDEISAGYHFVLGVTNNQEVYAWGDNEFGQLGDGTYSDASTPQIVPSLSNIKTVATTEHSSMAVTNSGALYVWGNNSEGQLATGNTSVINFPFLNSNVTDVDTVAGGRKHFLILKNDGTVWAVGNNDQGQLGQGNLAGSFDAIQVAGLSNIISIGTGEYHSFAIDANGDLYVWGNNGSGQLGLGDLINRLVPTLHTLPNVSNAQGGASHSLFLTHNKEVFTSGDNTYGQLGIGTTVSSTTPVKMLVEGAVQTSAGEYTSLLRRSDNTVYVSGLNNDDQLSSSTSQVETPEHVTDLEGVTFIEASQWTSHFIFGDSTACTASSISAEQLISPQVNIIEDGDTLIASETGVSYQWYLNGVAIPSGINQTHLATIMAHYYVEVTFANGCTSTSPAILHGMVSNIELHENSLSLYPNPTNNSINIEISKLPSKNIEIELLDQSGRRIHQNTTLPGKHLTIDLSDYSPGIYYLNIAIDQYQHAIKVIKQ